MKIIKTKSYYFTYLQHKNLTSSSKAILELRLKVGLNQQVFLLPPSSFFFWASYGSEFLKNTIIFQLFFINSFFSYQFIQCLWTVHSRKNPCFCTKNCIVIRVFVDYTRENIIFLKRFGDKNCLVVRVFVAIRSVKTSCFVN